MAFTPKNERQHKLMLDYDDYGNPDLKDATELLELVRLDAHKFLNLCLNIKRIVIKRSFHGYLLRTVGALTREEVDWLRNISRADSGYKFWSTERGKATLRIGVKPIVVKVGEKFVGRKVLHDVPLVIEILEQKR